MELSDAIEFARTHKKSTLVTMRRDGRPQLSNVLHYLGADGVIRISTTAATAKYRNLSRQPWAALHLSSENFFSYAVIEGDVELSPVASQPDDATVDELVEYYRAVAGEHDDWHAYRQAMVSDRRAVVRFRSRRAYGLLRDDS